MGYDALLLPDVDSEEGIINITLSRTEKATSQSSYGSVVSISFRMKDTAPVGSSTRLTIIKVKAYNSNGEDIRLMIEDVGGVECKLEVGGIAVWPGDTNNDGIVDEHDILPIGIYWLKTGPKRDVVDIRFKAQAARPWTPAAATYADADGNGIIDAREILVIGRNWGATHTVSSQQQQQACSLSEEAKINYIQCLDAYRAMYELLLDSNELDDVEQIKAALKRMIDKAVELLIPAQSELLQNYPNPFNPETWIPYALSSRTYVVIKIYNISGQLIRTLDIGMKDAGMYISPERAAYWDGKNDEGEEVASGVYVYQLHAGDNVKVKKMVVIK